MARRYRCLRPPYPNISRVRRGSGGFDLALLDASIRTLRDQLQQLESMRTAFQELQTRHQASSEQTARLTEQISRLDRELAQGRADSLRLEAELAAESDGHRRTSKALEDVTRRLEEATTAHNRERQELLNRLQLGIEGRLAAFKTSVADDLLEWCSDSRHRARRFPQNWGRCF